MKRFNIIFVFLYIILAIIVGSNISTTVPLLYFLAFSIVVLVLLTLIKAKKLLAVLSIIFALVSIYTFVYNIDPYVEQIKHKYTARVYGPVKYSNDKISFIVDNIVQDGIGISGKAYCTARKKTVQGLNISDGALLVFEGKSYFPDRPKGNYTFDFNKYLKQKRIYRCITSIKDISIISKPEYNIADNVFRIRERISNIFIKHLDSDNAVVARSLILSQRDGLQSDFREMFSRMGIAHIFSVSGLHVSIVAMCIFNLIKRYHWSKYITSSIAIIMLFVYCYITGFSPATMRAYIMFVYMMFAHMLYKQYQMINGLAISGIIILLINPLTLYTQSFIFSFSAVLGIYLFEKALSSMLISTEYIYPLSIWQKIKYTLTKAFTLGLSAQLGILIPSIYFYGQINILSILFNVLIVPMIGIYLMPLSLLSVCISFIPFLRDLVFYLLNISLSVFLWIVRTIDTGIFINLPHISVFGVLCIACIVAVLQKGLFNVTRTRKLYTILAIVVIFIANEVIFVGNDLQYTQLSVGKADCAVIHKNGKAVVFDLGETGDELLNFIKAKNLKIEDIYISHADKDHYGGIEALLANNISVKNIYIAKGTLYRDNVDIITGFLNQYVRCGSNVEHIAYGFEKDYKDFSVKAIFPKKPAILKNRPTNDNSLVLLIDLLGTRLLTTGDITKTYEKYAVSKCDILKVAHHGSNTSSSQEFLEQTNPSVAIISANNVEGFPSKKVTSRLESMGIRCYITGAVGDVNIIFNNGSFRIME